MKSPLRPQFPLTRRSLVSTGSALIACLIVPAGFARADPAQAAARRARMRQRIADHVAAVEARREAARKQLEAHSAALERRRQQARARLDR